MVATATEKLNNHFSVVSEKLLGKNGAKHFTNGGKRFPASKILSAGLLATRAAVLGDGCTTSYADFKNELGYVPATTARNVAELTRGELFKRNGQSKYTTAFDFDVKHGLPIYHFLKTEEFNGKRLSGNAVLFASNLIRHYSNPDRKQKYFIGGEKRVATFLNVAESTAHGVINELLHADVMLRFMMHDGKLTAGKGINADYPTVYIVNDKVMKRVADIHKQIHKQKAQTEALKKLFTAKPEPAARAELKDSRRKRNLIEEWQSTFELLKKAENSAETLATRFKDDSTFNQLKRDYITTNSKIIETTLRNHGQDTPELAELERQFDCILSDILNFLQSHNVQRKNLPNDLQAFIRDLILS